MALTGEQYTITAADYEATIVEVGAGLRRFRYRGADVTADYPDDVLPPKCCGAVLAPWPNRLRGGHYSFDGVDQQLALTEPALRNAIHGLARWARWTLVRHDPTAVVLAHDIVPQTGWPFEISVEISYALHGKHGLVVTARARNHGSGNAPFGIGFHPYLSCGASALADVTLQVPAEQRLVLDDTSVPVGDRAVSGSDYDLRSARKLGSLRLDDCFTGLSVADGRGYVEVRAERQGARLWFDETFGHVQVFTADRLPPGRSAAVAVEPMTCAPDAFNSGAGLLVLEPGAEWSGSWGITPL